MVIRSELIRIRRQMHRRIREAVAERRLAVALVPLQSATVRAPESPGEPDG